MSEIHCSDYTTASTANILFKHFRALMIHEAWTSHATLERIEWIRARELTDESYAWKLIACSTELTQASAYQTRSSQMIWK